MSWLLSMHWLRLDRVSHWFTCIILYRTHKIHFQTPCVQPETRSTSSVYELHNLIFNENQTLNTWWHLTKGVKNCRAYYRCTYRHTQGCLAKKQVQQTDRYQSTFEVIYRGKHTCMQETTRHNGNVDVRNKEVEEECTKPAHKVETQEKSNEEENFLDFSFPTTPVACENMEKRFCTVPQSIIDLSYSPPFLSPSTSESYFSLSPRQMNEFGIDHNLPSSGSDFTEIISNPTPLADFPTGEFDFLIDFVDFDTHLPSCLWLLLIMLNSLLLRHAFDKEIIFCLKDSMILIQLFVLWSHLWLLKAGCLFLFIS